MSTKKIALTKDNVYDLADAISELIEQIDTSTIEVTDISISSQEPGTILLSYTATKEVIST